MKTFAPADLRTVAIVAHMGSGKTSLSEAMLFTGKAVTRLGKTSDGTSTFDFEPEEVKREGSINSAFASATWKKKKVTIIDTPGDPNFSADTRNGLAVSEGAVLVISAVDSVQVNSLRYWRAAERLSVPGAVFVNKMDRERADFDKTLADIKERISNNAAAVTLPIGNQDSFRGVVDIIGQKALIFERDGSGSFTTEDIPGDMADAASAAREALMERVAESDDALLEKFFEEGELSEEELAGGLAAAVRNASLIPVLAGSASLNMGIAPLLDLIVNYFPSPLEASPQAAVKPGTEEAVERNPQADGPVSAVVFKTMIDPYAGKLTVMKVRSGVLKPDSQFLNVNTGNKERWGQVLSLFGKKHEAMEEAAVGEICAVAKLKETVSGHTLCDDGGEPIEFQLPPVPPPAISFAIKPKSKGDEDKVSAAINRLLEEDPTLVLGRDEQTHDLLLSGTGQGHLEYVLAKMQRKFGVEVELELPKVPYRETIRSKAQAEGKHKKQSGGRGQFGVCYIEIGPAPGEGFVFKNEIKGGAIPSQWIPSVEKGIKDRMGKGVIAGYPVVDISVRLYDGKYHDVDSSDMAFQMAGSKGFQVAAKSARPTLLEPIMEMEIVAPDQFMGDLMGDISQRRGRVSGTENLAGNVIVKAMVPMAEVLRYAPDLKAMTQGQGTFTMQQASYEEVPAHLHDKVVAESGFAEEEDD